MESLHHLGARRIAIASPYPERHNRAMADYLATHGFAVAGAEGMDVAFKRLQSVTPAEIRTFAEKVLRRAGPCDAIYLPCPQWQAAQIVDELERDIGIPVVAYTHASFFVAFKALGINDPIDGHGRLLASLGGAS
jgi:maleate isomerase